MEDSYDENLVSRQLGVYGKETMSKLAHMKVLILGMRGLGAEVAKNLILAGPKKVDILDTKKTHIRDLSANFYLKEGHALKRRRDRACVNKLASLNPYVKVRVVGDYDHEESEEESGSDAESVESEEEEKSEDESLSEIEDASEEETPMEEGLSEEESKEHSSTPHKKIEIDRNLIKRYDIVVVTEIFKDINEIIALNELCRELDKGFILSQCLGVCGYAFVDFGKNFICRDKTGEEHKSFNVVGISNAKEAEVTVHKGKAHSFSDGDHVVFREVKGMEELNDKEDPIKIKVIDMYTFKLELDTKRFGKYKREGIVQSVNVPTKINFQSLKESIADPLKVEPGFFNTVDLSCFGRPEQLHIALQAVHEYQSKNKRLPKNKRKEVYDTLDIAKKINSTHKKNKKAFSVEQLDENVVKLVAKFSRNQISPMTSFFGGIVCQEIVKFTGKFSPLQGMLNFFPISIILLFLKPKHSNFISVGQWLHYDMFAALPKDHGLNRKRMNSRYDDQIAIFGRAFQEKVQKQKTFVVGAGALGCEILKCFALMGVGCSHNGQVAVTDNDHIELKL